MFEGPNLERLRDLLLERQTGVWHACQLQDLSSYLHLGGVPSHLLLEQTRSAFTPLQSDVHDRQNGVWDKVFFNLSDFGTTFASGGEATPNPFGPIAIQLSPNVLRDAQDVAICLRSAGAGGFDRAREALTTLDEVERLFRYPASAGPTRGHLVRSGEALQAAFPGRREATSPELSCTYAEGVASFRHAVVVLVDPIDCDGLRLVDLVTIEIAAAGLKVPVRARPMTDERRGVLDDLVKVLTEGRVPIQLVRGRSDVREATRAWAGAVATRGLGWQYERFSQYLIDGTLDSMQGSRGPRVRHTPSNLPVGGVVGPVR